jgi:hypothetical protein
MDLPPLRQHSGATGDAFSRAIGARGTLLGFNRRFPGPIVLHSGGSIRPNNQSQGTPMKKSLRERLFGPSDVRDSNATALKKESALAKINEPDPSAKPRARRTVGLTEARLRAANQQSWMTSGKGWSDFLGRFTRPSRS